MYKKILAATPSDITMVTSNPGGNPPKTPLELLPRDILWLLFRFLDLPSTLRMFQVSRTFYQLKSTEPFQRILLDHLSGLLQPGRLQFVNASSGSSLPISVKGFPATPVQPLITVSTHQKPRPESKEYPSKTIETIFQAMQELDEATKKNTTPNTSLADEPLPAWVRTTSLSAMPTLAAQLGLLIILLASAPHRFSEVFILSFCALLTMMAVTFIRCCNDPPPPLSAALTETLRVTAPIQVLTISFMEGTFYAINNRNSENAVPYNPLERGLTFTNISLIAVPVLAGLATALKDHLHQKRPVAASHPHIELKEIEISQEKASPDELYRLYLETIIWPDFEDIKDAETVFQPDCTLPFSRQAQLLGCWDDREQAAVRQELLLCKEKTFAIVADSSSPSGNPVLLYSESDEKSVTGVSVRGYLTTNRPSVVGCLQSYGLSPFQNLNFQKSLAYLKEHLELKSALI